MPIKINQQDMTNPAALERILNGMQDTIDNVIALVNELRTDHGTVKSAIEILEGDYIITSPGLAIGSTATAVSSVAFDYLINGQAYQKAAVAAGTAPGNDVIPQSTYGAVAFDIGVNGTIDAVEAADNATGYASAALAVAGLPVVAADHARMGWVTASKSDGAFTFGTTDLDAANTTVAYTEADGALEVAAAAAPDTITAAAVTADVEQSL